MVVAGWTVFRVLGWLLRLGPASTKWFTPGTDDDLYDLYDLYDLFPLHDVDLPGKADIFLICT